MNLAICISGEMRTFEDCYDSLNKYILSKFNCDIFISTWNISENSIKENKISKNTKNINFKKLKDIYKTSQINLFEKPKNINKSFLNVTIPKVLIEKEPIHHNGAIPFSYLTYQTNLMLNRYISLKNKKYQAVIHMRPDLEFKLPIPDYIFNNMDTIWTLTSPHSNRVSDRFAISNLNLINIYASLWKKLNIYWQKPLGKKKYLFFNNKKNYLVGERLMNFHIKEINHLNLEQLPKVCDILRS